MYVLPPLSTTRNDADGRSAFSCFEGNAPSAIFVTAAVKLRTRPFVMSQAATAG
jgi:hypothetical protein